MARRREIGASKMQLTRKNQTHLRRMRRIVFMMRIWLFLAMAFLACTGFLEAKETREVKRIEHLIRVVETLEGSRFVRNGQEHEARAAADHLRKKLAKAGDRVKTAEEFVEKCASHSYLTKQPYQIRLPNGKTTEAGPFLLKKLGQYDRSSAAVTPASAPSS